MIAAHLYKRVTVYRDYRIEFEYTPVIRHYLEEANGAVPEVSTIQAVFGKIAAFVSGVDTEGNCSSGE